MRQRQQILILLVVAVAIGMANAGTPQQYVINRTWDSDIPTDNAQIHVTLSRANASSSNESGLLIEIDAPFYNEPIVPPSWPVGSTDKLWDFEVVEVFFLSESEEWYLETEFAPKGHYLLLQLDTQRNITKYELPLDNYKAEVNNSTGRWKGTAVIPWTYLPTNVNKFNAYAIHKSDPERVYMSLFPAPKGRYDAPDFHRLEFFEGIDLESL